MAGHPTNAAKEAERVIFTKEMKQTHTILVPTMLPVHFKLLIKIFETYGYKVELLENKGKPVRDKGLKYVHNDTCYPAQLVIGQMIDALESGKYDRNKVALLITQTGGGCRASNYIHLLRKAMKKAGYGDIPVISFNVAGLEKNPGFQVSLPMIMQLLHAVLYGDLFMLIGNQCRPYELHPGDTDKLIDTWVQKLCRQLSHGRHTKKMVQENYRAILNDFAAIPRSKEKKVRVGIVGEIFVKFSPLGNNDLEAFLLSEGAEPVMPGLMDFLLMKLYDKVVEFKMYRLHPAKAAGAKIIYDIMLKRQLEYIEAIKSHGVFDAPTPFERIKALRHGLISMGVKMGEGWLLPAEMLELVESGVKNIVCAQPFGCLPNHIVGKGMMKPIKEMHPDVNIVAIDYDMGATAINQENRIKLMLANARGRL